MSPRFSFRGHWLVEAPRDEVHAVLVDLERYPEWWPQVRAVARIDDDHARVLCRSVLPYTLDLVLTSVSRAVDRLEVGLSGDLDGSVRWSLAEDARGTVVDLRQDVEVTGRLVGSAARALRPVLRWNHARMIAGGLTGLRARLDQASSSEGEKGRSASE